MNANMKLTQILLLMFFFGALLSSSRIYGQGISQPIFATDVSELSIGDELPDLLIEKVFSGGEAMPQRLHHFNDRLLIIDFWSTYCVGCIRSFPKLDSLQRLFDGRIQILLSTYQTEKVVSSFMEKNHIGRRIDLPSVVDDKILGAYFPHRSIPHVVWINKGVVVAITGTEYVNAENIQRVLDGKSGRWPVKNEVIDYDYSQPFLQLVNDRGFNQGTTQYTALLGYQDGLLSKLDIAVDSLQGTRRGYLINLPVINAYFLLYMKTMDIFSLRRPHVFITPNQLIVEGAELSRFWYDREVSGYQAAWERENSFTLEVALPDRNQSDTTIYQFMIKELNRVLGLEAGFERRAIECLVLRPLSKEEDGAMDTERPSSAEEALQAMLGKQRPISNLVYKMNLTSGNPPVFDESEYAGEVEFQVDDWTDIAKINRKLKPLGLCLSRRHMEVDLFVVRKVGH